MDLLKHECGIAMVRLRQPLDFYEKKYGSWTYGLDKLYLLMEKQHNRGQEGAGISCVKLASSPGDEFMFRERAEGSGAISEVFTIAHKQIASIPAEQFHDIEYVKKAAPFAGESYMGHLRYSTTGRSGLSYVHPFMRRNNYRSKNLCLCGNFNLTNVDEVFAHIIKKGQHPRHYADTSIILEQIGHRLDREVDVLYDQAMSEGISVTQISDYIEDRICIENTLKHSAPIWDGGYVICGQTGSGESFAFRDPWGIRPVFYYLDDEVLVTASERPVIQTAFNVCVGDVKELQPGEAVICSRKGEVRVVQILSPKEKSACSFERIYFSRGSDKDIYRERKALGANLVPEILEAVNQDTKNSVFSYIPNTAEVAFYGMVQGLKKYLNEVKTKKIKEYEGDLDSSFLIDMLSRSIRTEKVAIKDIKLRTFISEGNSRNELAAHVYDITYGSIVADQDNLVIIDDSIVRGTTLKQSIIRILARLRAKKIVIVSSAPQIRYPDFYGIDMPNLEDLVAFKAAIALLYEHKKDHLIHEIYKKSKAQETFPKEEIVNYVTGIYDDFTSQQVSIKIAEILTPAGVECPVEIIYQSLEGLHASCPDHTGDWYFSGKYPTPGGTKLVNTAYIRFYEKLIAKS